MLLVEGRHEPGGGGAAVEDVHPQRAAPGFVPILCCAVFGPVSATYRLRAIDDALVARVLTAWSVVGTAARAGFVAAWGVLADVAGPRWTLGAAGLLLLAVPLLMPRFDDRTGGRPARHVSRPGHA